MRSTEEVLNDHIRLRMEGRLEDDLARNYHRDVAVLTRDGVWHGHDGIRECASALKQWVPDADYKITRKRVLGPYAMITWQAPGDGARACYGADSFVIRDGLIEMQSISFELLREEKRQELERANGSQSG